jgi:hypothetical protein
MAPASNMKLVTTAAALSLLGAEHAFTTRLLAADAPDAQGTLAGDLVVLGGADPCLREDLLAREGVDDPAGLLADLLEAAGVRRIEGRLVLDDGLLDRQWLNPDWKGGDIGSDYAAPIGALSIHGNCLQLRCRAAARAPPRWRTGAGLSRCSTSCRPPARRAPTRWARCGPTRRRGASRAASARPVTPQIVRVPVVDPAASSASASWRSWRSAHRRARRHDRAGCRGACRMSWPASESPLVNAVLIACKESDNGMADHIFKYLGALRGARLLRRRPARGAGLPARRRGHARGRRRARDGWASRTQPRDARGW